MSKDIPGLVETSLNLGIVRLNDEEFHLTASVRSSVTAALAALKDQLRNITLAAGGGFSKRGEYPAWEYRKDSPLRDTMVAVYEELYGKKPVVEAIHAGLECGLFSDKLPGLDSVSFGPNLLEIHTPRERMDIASVERTWNYLLKILENL
jgi:dipeptidase D